MSDGTIIKPECNLQESRDQSGLAARVCVVMLTARGKVRLRFFLTSTLLVGVVLPFLPSSVWVLILVQRQMKCAA